jgi:hypothetical protein
MVQVPQIHVSPRAPKPHDWPWAPPGICDLTIGMKRSNIFFVPLFFYEQLCVAAADQLDAWRHAVLKLNIAHSTLLGI